MDRISIDLTQARYLLAVVDEGHFTRAAQRLGVSQQTVSASLRRLEEQLGVVLLERTPRSVTLTGAGAVLVPIARDLVAASDRLNRSAQALRAAPRGTLRIGYTETAGHEVVPAVLHGLRQRWPELDVQARELWASELIPQLSEGLLDIGFGRCISGEANVRVERIRNDSLVVVTLADHPLAGQASVRLKDLSGERLVMFPRALAPGLHDALLKAVQSSGASVEVVASNMLGGGGLVARLRDVGGFELCARSRVRALPLGTVAIPVDGSTVLPVELAWPAGAPETARRVVGFVRGLSSEQGWLEAETAVELSAP